MKKITKMRYEQLEESEMLPEFLRYRIVDDKIIENQVWNAIYNDELPFKHIQKPFVFPFPRDSSETFHGVIVKSKLVIGCHPGKFVFCSRVDFA